jgi:hypothetical protein
MPSPLLEDIQSIMYRIFRMVQGFLNCCWWPTFRNFLILFFAIGKLQAQELLTSDQFLENLTQIIFEHGPEGADSYFHQMATEGKVDMSRLNEIVLAENGGNPKEIVVRIHPLNNKVIPYMQLQLEREKVTCIKLVAVEDENLPRPDQPFEAQKASYQRWTKARIGWVSLLTILGFMAGATVPDLVGWTGDNVGFLKIFTGSIVSMLVITVEIITSVYSSDMNTFLWSAKDFNYLERKPYIETHIVNLLAEFTKKLGIMLAAFNDGDLKGAKENFSGAVKDGKGALKQTAEKVGRRANNAMIKLGFNDISAAGNRLLAEARERKAAKGEIQPDANYYNINIFNYVYMAATFIVTWGLQTAMGLPTDHFWIHLAVATASVRAFYFACAKNQINIARLRELGYTDEPTRLTSELLGLYFAKPWRVMAEFSGPIVVIAGFSTGLGYLQVAGIALQFMSGLLVTMPSTRRLASIEKLARDTGAIFDRNAEFAKRGELVEQPFQFKPPINVRPPGISKCRWYIGQRYLRGGAPLPQRPELTVIDGGASNVAHPGESIGPHVGEVSTPYKQAVGE